RARTSQRRCREPIPGGAGRAGRSRQSGRAGGLWSSWNLLVFWQGSDVDVGELLAGTPGGALRSTLSKRFDDRQVPPAPGEAARVSSSPKACRARRDVSTRK